MKEYKLLSEKLYITFKEIPSNVKWAGIASAISFFLCHLYYFSNRFANGDDRHSAIYDTWHIKTGRWADGIRLSSSYLMPGIILILFIISISIAVSLLIDMFSINGKLSILVIALLMTTFPSLAYAVVYLTTAEEHVIAICFSVAAVYVTQKYRHGWILGAVMLAVSMGEYQSYVGLTMALCVISILLTLLKSNSKDTLPPPLLQLSI